MNNYLKRKIAGLLSLVMLLSMCAVPAFADTEAYDLEQNKIVETKSTDYIALDMSSGKIQAVTLLANNLMTRTQSLYNMANTYKCVAAINGTYTADYTGITVAKGTIIKEGKLLHIGNYGSTVGIQSSGKLIVDILKIELKGYVNGQNTLSLAGINDNNAIENGATVFTSEYGNNLQLSDGAVAVSVINGIVTGKSSGTVSIAANGYIVVFNASAANQANQIAVGDRFSYSPTYITTYTSASEWQKVQTAIGAGPSLIINGQVTADASKEGLSNGNLDTTAGKKSYIGQTSDGKIIIGTIDASTIAQAARVCEKLGLVNAMCLESGGSSSLLCSERVLTAGRNINNGIGFIYNPSGNNNTPKEIIASPTASVIYVNGEVVNVEAYNINGYNYFKIRDLAAALNGTEKQFNVDWNSASRAVIIGANQGYRFVGGEMKQGDATIKMALQSDITVFKDSAVLALTAYNINGNNYFKLRDIGSSMNFGVSYNEFSKAVYINTAEGYEE